MMVITNAMVLKTLVVAAALDDGDGAGAEFVEFSSKRSSVPVGHLWVIVRPFNGWTGRLVNPAGEKTEVCSQDSGSV